jgi:hypothetical protein
MGFQFGAFKTDVRRPQKDKDHRKFGLFMPGSEKNEDLFRDLFQNFIFSQHLAYICLILALQT